ncbi:MAG: radical SAM protein [Rhizomicrobium sp.]
MSEILHLNLELTSQCNQRCVYCFNESGPKSPHSVLNLQTWRQVAEAFCGFGLQSVHFTGGEPLMKRDISQFLKEAQRLGLQTSVLSNGFRIPDAIKQDPDTWSALSVVQISLDSARSLKHNLRRGLKDAWNDAISAIRALRRAQIPCEVSLTLSQENLEDLLPLTKFCARNNLKLIVRALQPIGRGMASGLKAVPIDKLENELDKLRSLYPGILTSDRFMYVPTSPLHDRNAALAGVLTVLPNGRFRGSVFETKGTRAQIGSVQELLAA